MCDAAYSSASIKVGVDEINMSVMQVLVNGQPQIDYDRNKPLHEQQQKYLNKMDEGMDKGITLDNEFIEKPDLLQRARFVASYLSEALLEDNEQMIAASTSWLALRLPDMKQIKIIKEAQSISIEMVFNEEQVNQVKVDLQMPSKGKPLH